MAADMKQCRTCAASKAVDAFSRHPTTADRLQPSCKSCCAAAGRQRRQSNPEKLRSADRMRYAADPARRERIKEYRKSHPEAVREAGRRHRAKYRDRLIEKHRAWNAAHPGYATEQSRKWREANPERMRDLATETRHRRRAASHNAVGSFTTSEFKDLCNRYGNVCLACGGAHKLTADHVVPLSRGGSNCIDNIQPLCGSCNSKKHRKTVDHRSTARTAAC